MKKTIPKITHYKKPTIATKKVKLNYFLSAPRIFDSFDNLIVPKAFAQSCCGAGLSCGGCCNMGICLSIGGMKYP